MKILDRIEEAICIICLIAMTTLVFANVFSRYVLHLSLSFSLFFFLPFSPNWAPQIGLSSLSFWGCHLPPGFIVADNELQ